jgi:hypothetical protein
MRHMAHFSVTFWPKTTPKSAQCDTVFHRKRRRIAVIAEKPASAMAYV